METTIWGLGFREYSPPLKPYRGIFRPSRSVSSRAMRAVALERQQCFGMREMSCPPKLRRV